MKIRIKNIFNKKEEMIDTNKKKEEKINEIEIPQEIVDNVDKFEKKTNNNYQVVITRKGAKNSQSEKVKKNSKGREYFDNLFKNKNKLSKGYYVLLFFMVILGTVSVAITAKSYNLFSKENYATYNNDETVTASSSIDTDNITKIEENINQMNKDASNVQEVKTEKKIVKVNTTQKVIPLSFSKSLNGEILKMFSDDKVIYSKTLQMWKIHDGLDIKANIGDNVKSIEKGKIEKIYDDSFLGTTIIIDHGQGYKSSYSNLDTNVKVKVNQTITKGCVIGKISNTAIGEIKDESHLHLMLFKDGNIVDPTYIFK